LVEQHIRHRSVICHLRFWFRTLVVCLLTFVTTFLAFFQAFEASLGYGCTTGTDTPFRQLLGLLEYQTLILENQSQ
jgi:hypothetical protein